MLGIFLAELSKSYLTAQPVCYIGHIRKAPQSLAFNTESWQIFQSKIKFNLKGVHFLDRRIQWCFFHDFVLVEL